MAATLRRPICLVGAARSGTTMLGESILAHHPDVAYWGEPVHVWRFGHAYRVHDVLTARDATPRIRSFIAEQFASFLRESGKQVLIEKTPSNCFRLPFILEIFPEARFLHILRDGRDVANSAAVEWKGGRTPKRLSFAERIGSARDNVREFSKGTHRFRKGAWSALEIPAYLPRVWSLFKRRLSADGVALWGPRFPGIRQVARTYSLIETCAIQWDWSVRAVLGFRERLTREQYLEIKYEDFLSDPLPYVKEILEFLGLRDHAGFSERITATVRPQNANKWRKAYSEADLARVMSHIGPTLRYLGYE